MLLFVFRRSIRAALDLKSENHASVDAKSTF